MIAAHCCKLCMWHNLNNINVKWEAVLNTLTGCKLQKGYIKNKKKQCMLNYFKRFMGISFF